MVVAKGVFEPGFEILAGFEDLWLLRVESPDTG
jgi:hypothetical protein